jgi:hypothetical protein
MVSHQLGNVICIANSYTQRIAALKSGIQLLDVLPKLLSTLIQINERIQLWGSFLGEVPAYNKTAGAMSRRPLLKVNC